MFHGVPDIAVVTKGAISVSKSIKVAGNSFDRAIMRQIKRERDIVIGELTAEDIKKRYLTDSATLEQLSDSPTINFPDSDSDS